MSNGDLTLPYSVVKHAKDAKPTRHETTWKKLCECFRAPEPRGKLSPANYWAADDDIRKTEKAGWGYIPSTFGDVCNENGSLRHKGNVLETCMLVFDFDGDGIEAAKDYFKGHEYFAHTTHSHHPNKPRWRLIVPFSKPCDGEHYQALYKQVMKDLNSTPDPATQHPAAIFYPPSYPPGGEIFHEREHHQGELFDPFSVHVNSGRSNGPTESPDVNTLRVSDAVKNLIKNGWRAELKDQYESRSEALFGVISTMMGAGYPDSDIVSVCTDSANGISERVLEQRNPEKYVFEEIRRCRAKSEAKGSDQAGSAWSKQRLAQLAAMSEVEYQHQRKALAHTFGVTLAGLDSMRRELRASADQELGVLVEFPADEYWHEPVDGAELLDALADTFTRYLVLPELGEIILALWTVYTHCYDTFDVSPYLTITSPVRACAKTRVLELLSHLTRRGYPTSSMSAAAMFRVAEKHCPSLLFDECHGWLNDKRDEMRSILNAGHTRTSAFVDRCEGDKNEVRRFRVWCPKVFALIGKLPDELLSRSIVLQMQRKEKGEKVAKFRRRAIPPLVELRRRCARFADDSREFLKDADPPMPGGLSDREEDCWEPLFTLADFVGGDWPERARKAATSTSVEMEDEATSIRVLAALRMFFVKQVEDGDPHPDKVWSEGFVMNLNRDEDAEWGGWNKGGGITQRNVAKLLKGFGVRPETQRKGDKRKKGFSLEKCQKAFGRYIPSSTSVTAGQVNNGAGFGNFSSVTKTQSVTDTNSLKASSGAGCHAVTDKKGGNRAEKENSPEKDVPEEWF